MKITLSRLLETAKLLQTEAGQQLSDLIEYVNTGFEQIVRALRNGLTFGDNFNCKIATIDLTHNTLQAVNSDSKTPIGIIPIRTLSTTTGVDSFIWYIDQGGQLQVKAGFVGSPSGVQKVTLIILF
jgi:hypothetical protein